MQTFWHTPALGMQRGTTSVLLGIVRPVYAQKRRRSPDPHQSFGASIASRVLVQNLGVTLKTATYSNSKIKMSLRLGGHWRSAVHCPHESKLCQRFYRRGTLPLDLSIRMCARVYVCAHTYTRECIFC